ncbi:DEAD/DEAH box helicase [Methylorubrum extorquens]|uniref:DEAD/DEAH box helicase domain protein n=1 Tax=Methylorubrum extorquens (strain CM4 / NCIMB 13688) TaxID=440085 RepID=B7L2W3_METC4|nr:DEAD/DEAH box helicase [Methylorubrum extorquens]ACK86171.1 DEAD/DEAH box helicase domain protein [Methylorubrum extorquens CM4]
MISSVSASERRLRDAAFDRLAPEVRSWVREQGWAGLRDIQVRAVEAVLDGPDDVLIAASTAAGKTEAAFLPILTHIADRTEPGLSVLYVSPLKALINDQFQRLGQLCERMEIPLVRWHGDAPQSAKARMLAKPAGIALITPESIEALLVRRPVDAAGLLTALDFVVVDEVHAFLTGPRGLHLASLLGRVDALGVPGRTRRVGLSATIGDVSTAAAWLRPVAPERVRLIPDGGTGMDLQLRILGYLEPLDADASEGADADAGASANTPMALAAITDHLFAALRGSNNLVFGGSRRLVEFLADGLRRRSERLEVPNEFFPHHGNLSKELREELEARLKDASLPTTAVCTSTLELGIDIGSVRSVAQVGAPRSLASLRQRLGRTGRRQGVPAILRIYVREEELDRRSSILDELRQDTVRAVAAIRLLAARFVEPPPASDAALATALLHQTLSVIAQRGGARADSIYRLLCGPGVFASVTPGDFAELLRGLARAETALIEQAPDGTLLLGERGERLVHSREFYALFDSGAEWRLVTGTRALGTIPLSNAISKGNLVLFAGRRWLVEEVDERAHVLQVSPHRGGVIPRFERLFAEPAHDRLLAEMRRVFEDDDLPVYLDERARTFLAEGRAAYRRLGLERSRMVHTGRDLHLFAWRGSDACAMLAVILSMLGLQAEPHELGVTLPGVGPDEAGPVLRRIAEAAPSELAGVSDFVGALQTAKYDEHIPEAMLRRFWARRNDAVIALMPSLAAEILDARVKD